LKAVVYTEFNIEVIRSIIFIDLVLECKPEQVTLVPVLVPPLSHVSKRLFQMIQRNGIRTSIFVDPSLDMIEGAKGTDRIELYTETFAHQYGLGNQKL
jgi:pyridoxine 5-phosphate synthase